MSWKRIGLLFSASVIVMLLAISCIFTGAGILDISGGRNSQANFSGWFCAPDSAKAANGLNPYQYCNENVSKAWLYLPLYSKPSPETTSPYLKKRSCIEETKRRMKQEPARVIFEILPEPAGDTEEFNVYFSRRIVEKTPGFTESTGIYRCCSLSQRTGVCEEEKENETWDECKCTAYFKFPGGEETFRRCAMQIEEGREETDCPWID